jgi:hypothetical protein
VIKETEDDTNKLSFSWVEKINMDKIATLLKSPTDSMQ